MDWLTTLSYTGLRDWTFSLSGYFGDSGQGELFINPDNSQTGLNANIQLWTGYAKYERERFRFVTVGAAGRLSDTDKIYELTRQQTGQGQVLGAQTFGYLLEAGYDLWPWLCRSPKRHRENWFYDSQGVKLSLFARYERLNTHQHVLPALEALPRSANDLDVWTVGMNFNPRENIVFKANYQYRFNRATQALTPQQDLIETGIGFIF
ncbi:hypothetical protein [Eisenibacter elegans]|uniref:hypothetical protein n=1 Tax=Eisenibacter elegans TaxID=997 RepID=UPI001378E13D|nr:hypothetical protein [Eisenibacter elegans]